MGMKCQNKWLGDSYSQQGLTVEFCSIQWWSWASPVGEGTRLQLQQSLDYNQTRPGPASGTRSYATLETEPSRPAQVCRVPFIMAAVSSFSIFKIISKDCLLPWLVQGKGGRLPFLLRIICLLLPCLFAASPLLGISLMTRHWTSFCRHRMELGWRR